MAIYKLGELFDISSGSTPSTKDEKYWNGNLNWYTPIDIKNNTHTDRMICDDFHKSIPKETVIMSSRAPIGYVGMTKSESWHSQGVKGFVNKSNDKIENKYFYYWLILNSKTFEKFSVGSTFSEISKTQLEKLFIEIPSIQEQQKIIDIIEPLETISTKIKTTKKAIISLLKMIANHKIENTDELLINHLTFEKGKNGPKEFETSGTPFLDVRTLNTRIPSKFVKDKPNTFRSEILLSLDATIGLVDWFIEGFNGYLYNLKSDHLTKAEILLNVLNSINKKIIEMNATGSTIKHASKAKKEMLYFKLNQEWKDITNTLFKLLILIEEIDAKKTKLYQLCINLLIR